MKRSGLFSPASLLCCALAIALGLGAGWLFHRVRAKDPAEPALHASASVKVGAIPPSEHFSSAPSEGSTPSSAKSDALAQALATSPRIERWLLLVAAAEKATPAEMPDLMRLCHGEGAALRMVAARWAELDPRHMWQTLLVEGTKESSRAEGSSRLGLRTSELARLLFESWMTRDPTVAREALSAAKDFPGIDTLRMGVLQPMMKSDPESVLRLMKEWRIRHWDPGVGDIESWAAKNPAHAAAVAKDCGTGIGALKAMEAVGKAWARSDPAAALAFAVGLPPMQRTSFAGGAMKQWAEKDSKAAAAYVGGLTDVALRANLALPLVEAWAKGAPQQALDWAQDTLRGEARAVALGSLVGSIAQQDVNRAAELVAGLDVGGSKNKAIGSLVDQWFQKSGATPVAEWLLKLPEADAREAGFEKLGWQWVWKDARGAAELAIGPQRDLVPANFALQVASNEARRDPEAAMKWIGQLPAATIPQARERVLGEWMQSRPEAAARWVLDQPAGDARRDLVTSATRNLSWASSPETAQKFFSQLPAADRATAREALRAAPIPAEKLQALSRALEGK